MKACCNGCSAGADVTRQLADFKVVVPQLPLSRRGLLLTEARRCPDSIVIGARLHQRERMPRVRYLANRFRPGGGKELVADLKHADKLGNLARKS